MTRFDVIGPLRQSVRSGKVMAQFFDNPPVRPPRARELDTASQELPGGTYARDPIYRAERAVASTITEPYVLSSQQEALSYVRGVLDRCASEYVHASWPLRIVIDPQQTGKATYRAGTILLPGPVRQLTLLHELAHHLAGASDTGHGPTFLAAFIYLIRQEMGPEIAQRLIDQLPT